MIYPRQPSSFTCYSPSKNEWFTVGYIGSKMYDDYSEITGKFSNSTIADFSIPVEYCLDGLYVYNPLNKKTAFIQLCGDSSTTLFSLKIFNNDGTLYYTETIDWDHFGKFYVGHFNKHDVLIYTSLPKEYCLTEDGKSFIKNGGLLPLSDSYTSSYKGYTYRIPAAFTSDIYPI